MALALQSRGLVIGSREKEREEKETEREKEEKNLQIAIRCLWDLLDWLWLGWSKRAEILTRNSQIQRLGDWDESFGNFT